MRGHLHTVWPLLRARVRPIEEPPWTPWAVSVADDRWGRIRLGGRFHRPDGARDLCVLVHGLGGRAESRYLVAMAHQAHANGMATLRLALRGSDGAGEDLYHAGLSSDLAAVAASPTVGGFRRRFAIGFSLGGHLVLRHASEGAPGWTAVAAISAPLDLGAGQRAIDRPLAWPYRRYVLKGLACIYREVASRRPLDTTPETVERVRSLWDFDRVVVVPRFGFADNDDYYHRASVGPRLGDLRVPALLVAAEDDPMVPPSAVRPWATGSPLTVAWQRKGGHVGFPRDLDLGVDAPRGLESQVLGWLQRHSV